MEVIAKLRHLRMSPRKVRLVTNLVKGLDVAKASEQLKFMNKVAAGSIEKLLQSAIANATNNNKLSKDSLKIKNILVNEGFTLKRWKPRAMGRATMIRKRSSHVTMILEGAKKQTTKKKTDNKQITTEDKKDKQDKNKKK